MRLFFGGDSFTPAGIDDYCSGNRNLLGNGVGYDRCLALLAELQPTHIFNCHVQPAFDFTAAEISHMRANLADRIQCYGQLFPWDQPNYGLDEQWVRCEPYEQVVQPGATVTLAVVITNHSTAPKVVSGRPVLPSVWNINVTEQQATIPPQSEGQLTFTIAMPPLPTMAPEQANHAARRIVIPIEVIYDGRALGQFREAIFIF